MKNLYNIILLLFSFSTLTLSFTFALETDTHEEINKFIASNNMEGFLLDLYLKNNLGFSKGINEKIKSNETKKIFEWIKVGGLKEDIPYWYMPYLRSVNHFHNPLTDQGYSGFWGTGFMSGMSSTEWMLLPQNTQSTLCYLGCYSWYDVRDYFYKALTSSDNITRNTYFAETFRGVGQLMHLIQDMSVPAHTRDDGHLFYNYEDFAQTYVNENGVPTPTSSNFFSGTINDIASLIDTDQYSEPSPDPYVAAGTNIGLSEYNNANFFSDDTINDSDFPYPQITETTPIIERMITNTLWNTTYSRQYYLKDCCGETNAGQGYLLSAVDYLDYYRKQYPLLSFALPKIPVLDDYVYEDYASFLIPRAVGYSAGLLDYFFRGTLEITLPDKFVYSIIDGSITPQQFTYIKAKVKNTTPDEEVQDGIIQAVAKYKIRPNYQENLSNDPPTEAEMEDVEFSYSVSEPEYISSLSSTTPQEFPFDFTNNPIPVGITDLYLFVVFKGTLGNETDIAIAAGMKDLNEPQHFSIWTATDRFYLDGVLRTADEIRNDPALLSRVDHNGDGIADEPIDPYDVNTNIAFYPTTATPTVYNATYTPLPPGRYGRIIILTDMPELYILVYRQSTEPPVEISNAFLYPGVINREKDGIFYNTEVTTFREIIQHQWTAHAAYYPDATGISTAPWPGPVDINPYPATIYP